MEYFTWYLIHLEMNSLNLALSRMCFGQKSPKLDHIVCCMDTNGRLLRDACNRFRLNWANHAAIQFNYAPDSQSAMWQNGHHLCKQHFKMCFRQWKCLYIDLDLTCICSPVSNWQEANIGPGNVLALIKQQTIFWTNDGLAYRCI